MERLFGQVKMLHSEICPSIFYYCYWVVKTQSSVKSRGRKNECLGGLTEFLLQKFAWGLTIKLFLKKLYSPFLWMGFNCLKVTEPLRGGSLLFTIKFPEIPGTHLLDPERMNTWFDLGATQLFWTWDTWIGNPVP